MSQLPADNMKGLFPAPPVITTERLCLRPLTLRDAEDLRKFTREDSVYRYLPTFLFERKYDDPEEVISRLYDECLKDSLILAVCEHDAFRGLFEVYSYRAPIRKVSVGYRLLEEAWGRGIATEALGAVLEELLDRRIWIASASTMPENQGSARVLEKNGFNCVSTRIREDWGFEKPIPTNNWLRVRQRKEK